MQSESSDGLVDSAILVIWQIDMSWCVLGDFPGEFYFRLYHMGIYTTKNQGVIDNKSMKENKIVQKF